MKELPRNKGTKRILKKNDLIPFYALQRNKNEIGGIIVLNDNNKGKKYGAFTLGSDNRVNADQLPDSCIQFHTHPSTPPHKTDEDAIEHVYKKYKNGIKNILDFPMDSLVQSISNSDLSTFVLSVMDGSLGMMVIFTPEGMYTLKCDMERVKILKQMKGNFKETIERILKYESDTYLENRDKIIKDEEENMWEKLESTSKLTSEEEKEKEMKEILRNTQIKIGKKVKNLIIETITFIICDFFPRKTLTIEINLKCDNSKYDTSYLKMNPYKK